MDKLDSSRDMWLSEYGICIQLLGGCNDFASLTPSSSDLFDMCTRSLSRRFHTHEGLSMILGMDEWTNSDTETEKEVEPAEKWLKAHLH